VSKELLLSMLESNSREVVPASEDDAALGPLRVLAGTWENKRGMEDRGWNMIALPFASSFKFSYRLMINQYNEKLSFTVADKGVKNRGIKRNGMVTENDQVLVALDYQQVIDQVAAEDFPNSPHSKGTPTIHHEPGLWLWAGNEAAEGMEIARLASIPHGDAVLALGTVKQYNGAPTIEPLNGFPIGVHPADKDEYLEPYFHFENHPFKGNQAEPFPGFRPSAAHELLILGMPTGVVKTTELRVSSTVQTGGISNIPFVVRQANAAEMNAIFYIMELDEKRPGTNLPRFVMQYIQSVTLDFFDRTFPAGENRGDGMPGRAHWPHISINTMEKTEEATLRMVTSAEVRAQ
jgi:hypothetical protein